MSLKERFERLAATPLARRLLAVSRVVLPILAFGYLAFVMRRLIGSLPPLAQIVPALRIAALIAILFPAVLLVLAWKWKAVLELVGGRKLPLGPTFAFYCETNIQKYLPSNVLHFASRIANASNRLDLEAATMGKALFVEVGADVLLTGVFLCGCVLILAASSASSWLTAAWRPGAAGAAAAVLATGAVIVLRKAGDSAVALRRTLPIEAVTTLVSHIYLGGAFVLLLRSMGAEIGWQGAVTVMFWQSGSWLIGFLTPGLPGGIGVREALLTATVGQFVDVRAVLIAAGLYRLAQVAGETLAFLVSARMAPRQAR